MFQTFTKNYDNHVVTGYGHQYLLQDQLPAILTNLLTIILTFMTQCSMFTIYSAIHLDISRHFLKKLCILVIANVNNSLKQCNGCDNTKWASEQ
jgi:hypothetical protein